MMAAFGRASLRLVDACRGAGSPPGRAGNFSLSRRRKVTKREALNRTRAPRSEGTAKNSLWQCTQMRTAALPRLTCDESASSPHLPVRRAAACRAHENSPIQRRSGDATVARHPPGRRPSDAVFAFADEPGVQPALSGLKGRCMVLFTGTAARAKRVASSRNEDACFRAPVMAARRSCAVQRLFFGDFLLAPQKKVTRPPGRTPGTALATNPK